MGSYTTHFLLSSFTQHYYFEIYACHCTYYEFIPIPNPSLAALCTRPSTSQVGVRANSTAASPKVGMRLGATLAGVGGSPGPAHECFPGWLESPPCHGSPNDRPMLRPVKKPHPPSTEAAMSMRKGSSRYTRTCRCFPRCTHTHSSAAVSQLGMCLCVEAALSPLGMLSQRVGTAIVPTQLPAYGVGSETQLMLPPQQ